MVSGRREATPEDMSMDSNTDSEPMDISNEVNTSSYDLGANK